MPNRPHVPIAAPEASTHIQRIVRSTPNEKGWVNLEIASGDELVGELPDVAAVPILTLMHLSDLHVCDAQSPARVELMDRYADPHHPMSEHIPFVGAYRAQELMTTQTLESVIQTANSIQTGLFSDRIVDAVVVTGDVTDNAQANELSWYLTLMDGGVVHPDSGDTTKWEGVAQSDPDLYDPFYWNPEGTPSGCEDDYPRALYGFPEVPGLTSAVREPFTATGLKHRWFATHGNHDGLLQGTVPSDETLTKIATGDQRLIALATDTNLQEVFSGWNMVGPAHYADPSNGSFRHQSADPRRRFNAPQDWAKIHLECEHEGHGLTEENAVAGTKYWSKAIGEITLISLDTVNEHGGWMGSLDEPQFVWLKQQLSNPDPKYFVLLSHHPLHGMFNDYAPVGASRRIAIDELTQELLKHDRIIAWLAGHDHDNRIKYIGNPGENGFWQIMTASLIDWPQQGRLVEFFEDGDGITIATTLIDHQSPIDLETSLSDIRDPIKLAGLSRILSANHWQRRRENEYFVELAAGQAHDRNRILRLNMPERKNDE